MGTGFNKRKKQAKMMQEKSVQMQEQMKTLEVTGAAVNNLVEITINGDNDIVKVKIKPECVDPEDVEGLEDLIKAAHHDALKKLQKESPLSGGFPGMGGGMPGLQGLPGLGGLGL
jgi:DNA-binding YbaB/EbfC family protein